MIKEQRKSKRQKSQSALYYRFPGNQDRVAARCMNLSNNGMSLESEQLIEPQKAIHVCLYSRDESAPPLEMLVKVVWSKELDSGQYCAGTIIKAIMAAQETSHV